MFILKLNYMDIHDIEVSLEFRNLSEYDYDLHEHEFHRQSYYTYNLVSPRTKQKAIQRLLAEN